MIWRAFRRVSSPPDQDAAWWADANAAATAITADGLERLRARLTASTRSQDDLECQEEMLDGLQLLLDTASGPLPVVDTQHRVIGADVCHLAVPATLAGDVDTPGKLFVTSARLIFAGGRVQAWPWHRIRQLVRVERRLAASVSGAGDSLHLACNSYGDAIVAAYIAGRLRSRPA